MEILKASPAHLWDYPANAAMLALIYHELGQRPTNPAAPCEVGATVPGRRTSGPDSSTLAILALIDWMANVILREVFRREVSTRS